MSYILVALIFFFLGKTIGFIKGVNKEVNS